MRLICLTDLDNGYHSNILTLAFRERRSFVKMRAENLVNEKESEIWSWWAQETQSGYCRVLGFGFVLFLNMTSWVYGRSRQWFFSNAKAVCKCCGLYLWGYINLRGKINIKLIIRIPCQWGKFFLCAKIFSLTILSPQSKRRQSSATLPE